MAFNANLARKIASLETDNTDSESGLVESFVQVCSFLSDNPNSLSPRGSVKPSLETEDGLKLLARRYFGSYRRSDFPSDPHTIPDEMVSIVLQHAYGYKEKDLGKMKVQHQHSMNAESCIGNILERYLYSVLRSYGWHWCGGNLVRAIDFIKRNDNGTWLVLQIKNRDNSENSSSRAVRDGTLIQKWFRSFSRTGKTNWDNLPDLMRGYELSEEGFIDFVREYLEQEKLKLTRK